MRWRYRQCRGFYSGQKGHCDAVIQNRCVQVAGRQSQEGVKQEIGQGPEHFAEVGMAYEPSHTQSVRTGKP